MSKTITIITGSARTNSTGAALLPLVKAELAKHPDITIRIADLKELNMPFVDGQTIPAADDFTPPHDSVKKWQEIVQASDGFVVLAPEYNNQISAIQKNAFDWLFNDWKEKKFAIVTYSWSGGAPVVELLNKLITKVGGTPLPTASMLAFMKDINPDGSVIDSGIVRNKLAATVAELVNA